jgi:hypothetical protein
MLRWCICFRSRLPFFSCCSCLSWLKNLSVQAPLRPLSRESVQRQEFCVAVWAPSCHALFHPQKPPTSIPTLQRRVLERNRHPSRIKDATIGFDLFLSGHGRVSFRMREERRPVRSPAISKSSLSFLKPLCETIDTSPILFARIRTDPKNDSSPARTTGPGNNPPALGGAGFESFSPRRVPSGRDHGRGTVVRTGNVCLARQCDRSERTLPTPMSPFAARRDFVSTPLSPFAPHEVASPSSTTPPHLETPCRSPLPPSDSPSAITRLRPARPRAPAGLWSIATGFRLGHLLVRPRVL